MDWIERLTGLSPDAGSGALELTFSVVAVVIAVLVAVLRAKPQRAQPEHHVAGLWEKQAKP